MYDSRVTIEGEVAEEIEKASAQGVKKYKTKSSRVLPRYTMAVEWVASEDDPLEMDPKVLAGTLTVCLVADLWGKPPALVAEDVVKVRVWTKLQEERKEST
jgi:hypothetical protein